MSDHEFYVNPLCTRYSGEEMKRVFSDNSKFSTWRRLWVALAESERELGIPITEEQIAEMRGHINDIDYAAAAAHELGEAPLVAEVVIGGEIVLFHGFAPLA